MVYCNIVNIYGEYAVYKFGYASNKMTGLVRFYVETPRFVVEQQTEEKRIPDNLLARVWLKYQDSISKGVFPEKMSIQIG